MASKYVCEKVKTSRGIIMKCRSQSKSCKTGNSSRCDEEFLVSGRKVGKLMSD